MCKNIDEFIINNAHLVKLTASRVWNQGSIFSTKDLGNAEGMFSSDFNAKIHFVGQAMLASECTFKNSYAVYLKCSSGCSNIHAILQFYCYYEVPVLRVLNTVFKPNQKKKVC